MTRLERLALGRRRNRGGHGSLGLDARDLAGDEVHMLVGTLWITVAPSIHAEASSVTPWSYWLRWVALTLGGDAAGSADPRLTGAALAAGLGTRIASLRLGIGGGVQPVSTGRARCSPSMPRTAPTTRGPRSRCPGPRRAVGSVRRTPRRCVVARLRSPHRWAQRRLLRVHRSRLRGGKSRMVLRKPTSRADIAKAWAPSILILRPPPCCSPHGSESCRRRGRCPRRSAGTATSRPLDVAGGSSVGSSAACRLAEGSYRCAMGSGGAGPTGVAALAAAIRGRAGFPFVLGAALSSCSRGHRIPCLDRRISTNHGPSGLPPALACVLVAGLSRLPPSRRPQHSCCLLSGWAAH